MKVKDIMTRDVITVGRDMLISDISQILFRNRIHGVPVVENGIIMGIITETDFFSKGAVNVYLPGYIDFLKNDEFSNEMTESEQEKVNFMLHAKASDIMSSPCVTINEEADLNELLGLIKGRNLNTVPVIDKNGNLAGIITVADLIKLLKIS